MSATQYVSTRSNISADGRDLSKLEWRVVKDFPKYQISQDGDIRHRDTFRVLQEIENKRTGAWFYSLWKDDRNGTGRAYNRNYQRLLYKAFPELLDGWTPIPDFPNYLVSADGSEVMGTRLYKPLYRDRSGAYRLRRDGKMHSWRASR